MAFVKLCEFKDLSRGMSAAFSAEGREVLLLSLPDSSVKAFQGTCPHQDISLADALFDGTHLICQAHRWTFDARTGDSAAPHFCRLTQYEVKIDGGSVFVDVAAKILPYRSKSISA